MLYDIILLFLSGFAAVQNLDNGLSGVKTAFSK